MTKKKSPEKKYLSVINSYKRVFQSSEGKIVLMDLMRVCNITRVQVSPGADKAIDPYELAIREGMRMTILHVLDYLRIDERKLLEMVENQKGDDYEW